MRSRDDGGGFRGDAWTRRRRGRGGFVRLGVHGRAHVHVHVRVHVHDHDHAHAHAHAQVHVRVLVHAYVHVRVRVQRFRECDHDDEILALAAVPEIARFVSIQHNNSSIYQNSKQRRNTLVNRERTLQSYLFSPIPPRPPQRLIQFFTSYFARLIQQFLRGKVF